MIVKIDAVEVSSQLADEKLSFETKQKVFKEIGINRNNDDYRNSEEWKKHYEYYFKTITNASEL